MKNQNQTQMLSTGYTALDGLIGGFNPTQLITIASRASEGKSAFALNLALNFCDQGEKVAFWNFETSKPELIRRILAIRTGFSSDKDINKITEEHCTALRKYIEETKEEVFIKTNFIYDLNNFALKCKDLKEKHGVKVVIIDNVQMVCLNNDNSNDRPAAIDTITKRLKQIAEELEIIVIIVSQLSRITQDREDTTPILSDFECSSSIEKNSDIVIFLHTNPDNPQQTKIIFAKTPNGLKEQCVLSFIRSLTKFVEAA